MQKLRAGFVATLFTSVSLVFVPHAARAATPTEALVATPSGTLKVLGSFTATR